MRETDLLAAIRDQPYLHAPRLVYADWLEENGRPEKAAVIRAQFAKDTPNMVLVVNPWDFVCQGRDGTETPCEDWFSAFVTFDHRARFRSPWSPRFPTAFTVRDEFSEVREIGVRDRKGITVIGRAKVTLATLHPERWFTVEIEPC